jgi:hypothetical protein
MEMERSTRWERTPTKPSLKQIPNLIASSTAMRFT